MSNDRPGLRRIAVVGGGITGLSAALRLGEAAPTVHVDVLEASDRLGGVIQTEHRDGFTLEHGPDSLLRRLLWGVGLCERLGIGDQLVGTQPQAHGAYTVHRGRAIRMPEGMAIMACERVWPVVATPILSWRGKLRMAAERVVPRRADGCEESLAAFARRRLGREAYERIVQPLAGGIFMGDPERLSVQACFPQFTAMEAEHGSLMKATRAARKKRLATSNGSPPPGMFVAPAAGLSTIVNALGSRLGSQSVRLGQRVQQLEPTASGWRLGIEHATTGRQSTELYDAVIVALPAGAAARLLRQIDERAAELLAAIEYSSCVVVQLAYPVDCVRHPLDAAGLVVPDVEGRSMQACSFSSVKYAGRAPDGTVLFRAFFGGALRPELLDLDDESLVDLAKREVGTLLAAEGEPLLTSVTRWRNAMPQYHLGHLQRVDEIQRRIDRHTGLALAGAFLRGVGIPHCIHSGQRAAEQLLATMVQQTENGKQMLAESF